MVSIPSLPSGLPRSRQYRVANRLHSLSIRLLRAVRDSDAASGLSGPRLSALSVVVYAGPLPITRLAKMEGVSVAAATKMAQALEGAALVTRSRAAEDQRIVTVSATDAGRQLLEEGRARRVAAMAQLLSPLSAAELRVVDEALATLVERL